MHTAMPALPKHPWRWIAAALLLLFLVVRLPGWWFGPEVTVYRVEARPIIANVVATGRVESPSRVLIGSEIVGTVVERPVFEGQHLAAGALVARLDDANEQAALAAAEARARASGPAGSSERLLRERIAAARAALEQTVVRTRVSGTVLRRLAEPGDVVQPGRGIVELARDGSTLVVAQVDERNLDRLVEDLPALVSPDAFPQQRLPGRLVFLAPAVDPQTGTVEVRVEVPDAPPTLRQDMTVSVDIEVGRRERALVLPIDAIEAARGDAPAQVLAIREGRVERVPVTLGLRGLDRIEVIEGLAEGEAVLPLANAPAPGRRVRIARDGG